MWTNSDANSRRSRTPRPPKNGSVGDPLRKRKPSGRRPRRLPRPRSVGATTKTTKEISAKIQEMTDVVTFVSGEPTAVKLSAEQAAAALRMAANGVADGDVTAATAWLQEKLREGGVAGLETALSQVPSG